jgi:O-succinylbenzoate synthase
MKIARAEAFRYSLPLRAPLTLKGVTLLARTGYLLKLTSDSGAVGWGDAAPLPGFSEESAAKVEETLRWAIGRLEGYRLPEEYTHLEGAGLLKIEDVYSVAFALETAYFALMAAERHQPLYEYLDPATRPYLQLNALLTGPREEVLAQARQARDAGYKAVKVKVGGNGVTADIALAEDLRDTLGPDVAIRADANRQWSVDEAVRFASATFPLKLEYIEEPVHQMTDLVGLYTEAGVPYAVDETLYGFYREIKGQFSMKDLSTQKFAHHIRDLTSAFRHASACVWKPTLIYRPNMGGELASGRFAFPVKKLVISACFESGVGIAHLANLAAVYGGSDVPAGLDTYRYLAEDLLENPLPLEGGCIDLDAVNNAASHIDEARLQPL